MLKMRKHEIVLRKLSGGTAHLRTLEGTLNTIIIKNYLLFLIQCLSYAGCISQTWQKLKYCRLAFWPKAFVGVVCNI